MDKFFESELRVLEVLWDKGEMSAGALAKKLAVFYGWNRNTTYTVVTKLVRKGLVEREDPGFLCRALVTREEAQRQETENLISRMFNGSRIQFLSAFLSGGISDEEAKALREMVEKLG